MIQIVIDGITTTVMENPDKQFESFNYDPNDRIVWAHPIVMVHLRALQTSVNIRERARAASPAPEEAA